jgi:hypothetical protein
MKKIAILILAIILAIPAVAAWAGEYFSPAEKDQIRRIVAEVLPRAEVDFVDTEIKGAGVLIGPLPDGNNLFIHANSDAEIFTYQLPAEYMAAAMRVIETVYRIVDNRPASVALGRDLIE